MPESESEQSRVDKVVTTEEAWEWESQQTDLDLNWFESWRDYIDKIENPNDAVVALRDFMNKEIEKLTSEED